MSDVIAAQFTVPFRRILTADGALEGPLPAFASESAELLALMRGMLRARRFDRRAVALQRTGIIGTYASCLGQEAIGVGVGAAMTADDVLAPSYREAAIQLWRGVSPLELILFWGGDERGSNFAVPERDFPVCITVGGQALHAVGAAYAMRQGGEPGVAVSVSGDGSTSKGEFYEALNFAGVFKAPVVFVINNNQWAISVPRAKQTASATIAQKAIAAGIACEQIDGNDILGVRAAAERALLRARTGGGATLIEALSYRLSDHTTSDDATRYRDPKEVTAAFEKEPLKRYGTFLRARGLWDDAKETALTAEIDAEIERAVEAFRTLPPEPATAMFDHLFATLPAPLAAQRARFADTPLAGNGHG